jgi:hypothetical protein
MNDDTVSKLKFTREDPKSINSLVEYRRALPSILYRTGRLEAELTRLRLFSREPAAGDKYRNHSATDVEGLHPSYHATLRDSCFCKEADLGQDQTDKKETLRKCRFVLNQMKKLAESDPLGSSIYGPAETFILADAAASRYTDKESKAVARLTGSNYDGTPYKSTSLVSRAFTKASSSMAKLMKPKGPESQSK